jgi:WD40 repeat protein
MMRFLVPIAFPYGPTVVAFHPNYTANVLAGSQDGNLLMNDLNDTSKLRFQYLSANLSGYLTSLSFSSSGEILALGSYS